MDNTPALASAVSGVSRKRSVAMDRPRRRVKRVRRIVLNWSKTCEKYDTEEITMRESSDPIVVFFDAQGNEVDSPVEGGYTKGVKIVLDENGNEVEESSSDDEPDASDDGLDFLDDELAGEYDPSESDQIEEEVINVSEYEGDMSDEGDEVGDEGDASGSDESGSDEGDMSDESGSDEGDMSDESGSDEGDMSDESGSDEGDEDNTNDIVPSGGVAFEPEGGWKLGQTGAVPEFLDLPGFSDQLSNLPLSQEGSVSPELQTPPELPMSAEYEDMLISGSEQVPEISGLDGFDAVFM